MDEASSSKTMNSSISEMSTQRMISMQRDLTAAVTNIQTAADARESTRRKELQEARKVRLELLENNVRSSQIKAEEIFAALSSTKEKVIPQELQEALNTQQNICTLVLEDKDKLINDLQKELRVSDDRFVKDLRRMAEELDLMKERMEDQIKTLTEAYREEMSGVERFCLQEIEVLVTKDKSEWEKHMKDLWDQELERLEQRKEKVVEYEAKIHHLMLDNMDKESIIKIEQDAKFQVLDIENQKMKASTMIMNLQQIKQKNNVEVHNFNLSQMYERISSLQVEIKKLVTKFSNQAKYLRDTSHHLKKDYKRILEQHERVQKKIKHFAVADAGRFKEMWRMVEAEMALLVEKALATDSEICVKHLGLAWDRPVLPFRELPGRPKKQTNTDPHTQLAQTEPALQCSQGVEGAEGAEGTSEGASSEAESTAVDQEGSDAGLEEETLVAVSHLLCDATGLIQESLLMLLTPLEEDVQMAMKLGSSLYALGLADKDFPKLAHFLLKYRQEQSEDVSGESASSDQEEALIINPNQVLIALKGFLQQHKGSRENSDQSQSSVLQTEPRDSLADRVYWESLSNIITEDKVRLWEAAEESLQQHLVVLTEISELDIEKESLEQENTELRLLLQQSLSS